MVLSSNDTLSREMVNREDRCFSDEMMGVCGNCCQTTWAYPQPNGTLVQLDNIVGGPFVIFEDKAYEVGGISGYRRHSDSCTGSCRSASALPFTSEVSDDDFLWR
jgi:hypothetical protein